MRLLIKALLEVARRTPNFRGKTRALWYLVRALSTRDEFLMKSGGATFSIRGEDICEYWMAIKGIHSEEIYRKICLLAGDDEKVVWDIGANIGTMTLPLLATKPNLKVVAFEPSPDPCSRLLRNARLNQSLLPRLMVFNCALGDTPRLTKFYVSNETFNSGVGGIGYAQNRNDFPVYTVVQTAKEIMQLAPNPDIIKIDVEGHELSVLKGIQDIFDVGGMSIIFEHSLHRLEEVGQSLNTVPDFLASKGFKMTQLNGGEKIDWNLDQDLLASK